MYKKGPLAKPSLFDTVEGIGSSELAETIHRKRMEDQYASRYSYNPVAYRMGPEKDVGEASWNRFHNYNLSLQLKSRLSAGAKLMLSASKSAELQASFPSARVDKPTVHPEDNSSKSWRPRAELS